MDKHCVSQLIDAATSLTENCIPVVLLKSGLKAPMSSKDGSWLTLTDPDQVAAAIHRVSRVGAPNLGVLLAPKSDSPLMVVDLDGPEAYEKLRELGVSSSGLVWIARTGRGGYHTYFRWDGDEAPPSRVIRARKLPVDLLSNGFAVVPPSDTSGEPKGGGPYRWVSGHSPADIPLESLDPLPDPLLNWWHDNASGEESAGAHRDRREVARPSQGHHTWRLLNETIGEGSRNDTLTRIAGWLRLYHPPDVVEALLLLVNTSRCVPPLDSSEVKAIVRSVFKYPQPGVNGHPRAVVANFYRREMADGSV